MGKLESDTHNRVVCEAHQCKGYTWYTEPIAGGQQVAHIHVSNEENYCNPFPDKAGIECRSNLET